MATYRQRGKRWEAQVRRKGFPPVTHSFSTKADARAWASVVESEMARGVFVDRTEAEKNTLGDLLCRYRDEISKHKKGADSERYRIELLLRNPITQIKISALSGKRLAEWRDERLKKVSGSTVNRDLNLISHAINVSRKEWGIHVDNPVAMIRRPKENKARSRRLLAGEEERLLAALEAHERDERGCFTGPQNEWIKPLVIVAIESAMRRGELLSLRWADVFLEDRFVRLRDTKNGESRDVPLSTRARDVLTALPRVSAQVFPLSFDAVKKAFTRAVARAGIEDLHFHDLRHEATSRIAEKLDNVLELSSVTGHKTLAMLKRYYHPRAKDLAQKLG